MTLIVKDPDTGEVIHHCSEPLSQHRNQSLNWSENGQRATTAAIAWAGAMFRVRRAKPAWN